MKIGFCADLDGIERGLVARVRDVDGDAELVHAQDRGATELGQATVVLFAQSAAQRVGLAVGDARRADAQSVQDVQPIELVLDRRGRLERRNERDLTVLLGAQDVFGRFGANHHVLVGDVGQAHAQVPDDVVPLPAGLGRDARGAIHQAVKDRVDARDGQALVAGPVAAGAAVLEDLLGVLGHDERMVVQRDDQALRQQFLSASLLLRRDFDNP